MSRIFLSHHPFVSPAAQDAYSMAIGCCPHALREHGYVARTFACDRPVLKRARRDQGQGGEDRKIT